jgi:hypothetical protein
MPSPGLVVLPQLIAKRFDHMVGCNAEVRRSLFDHLQRGVEDGDHGAVLGVLTFVETTQPIEMPEQLVRAVD